MFLMETVLLPKTRNEPTQTDTIVHTYIVIIQLYHSSYVLTAGENNKVWPCMHKS